MFLWIDRANGIFASKKEYVLLEIIPSREIEKSPHPMELIFAGFSGTIKTPSTVEEFIGGEFPTSFSLELVSTEGKVHFYIRTPRAFPARVEGHLDAH
ncbi:MAG: hypothetical protein E6P95_02745 [Candidatus Moraniibacteriota bacterium]|nr:MAG: hypothetical protein E6P95_02745 [Candidatus Moranbacteria bacterium]